VIAALVEQGRTFVAHDRPPRHRLGVEKPIERGDLAIADDDHVLAGVVGLFSSRTGTPRETAGVMECLRRAMRRVCEVRMRRARISCELVQRVVPHENALRYVNDTVIGAELLDRRAAARRVALTENVLEHAVEQFMNAVGHGVTPFCFVDLRPCSG
jgi:hypothetical protein